MTDLSLKSPAFKDGKSIPKEFSGYGKDISPPLSISNVPKGTKSLALIVDDPDAKDVAGKIWVHWVMWDIPPDTEKIPKGIPRDKRVGEVGGALQGKNDFKSRNVGYRGPKPPRSDHAHTYKFKLYALNTELDLPGGERTNKEKLLNFMDGHVIEQALLTGKFKG